MRVLWPNAHKGGLLGKLDHSWRGECNLGPATLHNRHSVIFQGYPLSCTRPSTFGMIDLRELQPLFFRFSSLKEKSAFSFWGKRHKNENRNRKRFCNNCLWRLNTVNCFATAICYTPKRKMPMRLRAREWGGGRFLVKDASKLACKNLVLRLNTANLLRKSQILSSAKLLLRATVRTQCAKC